MAELTPLRALVDELFHKARFHDDLGQVDVATAYRVTALELERLLNHGVTLN